MDMKRYSNHGEATSLKMKLLITISIEFIVENFVLINMGLLFFLRKLFEVYKRSVNLNLLFCV